LFKSGEAALLAKKTAMKKTSRVGKFITDVRPLTTANCLRSSYVA